MAIEKNYQIGWLDEEENKNFNLLFHPLPHTAANPKRLLKKYRPEPLESKILTVLQKFGLLTGTSSPFGHSDERVYYNYILPYESDKIIAFFNIVNELVTAELRISPGYLILNETSFGIINSYLNKADEMSVTWLGLRKFSEIFALAQPLLNLEMFLHNYCYIYAKKGIVEKIKRGLEVAEHYMHTADTAVYLNNTEKAQHYFLRLKKIIKDSYSKEPLIKAYQDNYNIKTIHLGLYYVGMSKIASLNKEYTLAKKYALKASLQNEYATEAGLLFNENFREFSKKYMTDSLINNQFEEALFWAKCAKKNIINNIAFNKTTLLGRKFRSGVIALNSDEYEYKSKNEVLQNNSNKVKSMDINHAFDYAKDYKTAIPFADANSNTVQFIDIYGGMDENKLIKSERELSIIEEMITQIKSKIFNANIECLQKIFQTESVNITLKAGEKYSLCLKLEESEYISLLTNSLRANGYICAYDAKNQLIVIHNLLDVNNEKMLPRVIKEFKRILHIKNETKVVTTTSSHITTTTTTTLITTPNETTSTLSNLSGDELITDKEPPHSLGKKSKNDVPSDKKPQNDKNTPKLSKKEKKMARALQQQKQSQENDQKNTNIKSERVIRWGKEYPIYKKESDDLSDANMPHNPMQTMYKVKGHTTLRHHLFINPALTEYVSDYYPDHMKNLVRMCKRGKTLNNSKKGKGILIKGNQAKIKDCTKKYRFYGEAVAATTVYNKETKKHETHQLFEINGFKLKKEKKEKTAPMRFK